MNIRSSGTGIVCSLSLLFVLSISSCSRSRPAKAVFPVHGQVLLDGKPLAGAMIVLHPAGKWEEPSRPYGETDRDGRFLISTFGNKDGAPPGDYKVAVSGPATEGGENTFRPDAGEPQTKGLVTSPARYGNPETSGLRIKVNEAKTDLQPFQLKTGS